MLFSKSLITKTVCCEAVQSAILATAWLLVHFIKLNSQLYSALSYLQETSKSVKFGKKFSELMVLNVMCYFFETRCTISVNVLFCTELRCRCCPPHMKWRLLATEMNWLKSWTYHTDFL